MCKGRFFFKIKIICFWMKGNMNVVGVKSEE